jgi:hypothetical protein
MRKRTVESGLENGTPQKTEVKTSSFRGILFGINRLMDKEHPPKQRDRDHFEVFAGLFLDSP